MCMFGHICCVIYVVLCVVIYVFYDVENSMVYM